MASEIPNPRACRGGRPQQKPQGFLSPQKLLVSGGAGIHHPWPPTASPLWAQQLRCCGIAVQRGLLNYGDTAFSRTGEPSRAGPQQTPQVCARQQASAGLLSGKSRAKRDFHRGPPRGHNAPSSPYQVDCLHELLDTAFLHRIFCHAAVFEAGAHDGAVGIRQQGFRVGRVEAAADEDGRIMRGLFDSDDS